MGQDWKPNQALSIDLLLRVLERIEEQICYAENKEEENKWTVMHTYVTVSYVVSLRGPEGFLLDLESLRDYW